MSNHKTAVRARQRFGRFKPDEAGLQTLRSNAGFPTRIVLGTLWKDAFCPLAMPEE